MISGLDKLRKLAVKQVVPTASRQCDTRRVLVVDDEPEIVRVFGLMIRTAFPSVDVDRAYDGTQALATFQQHHHAVVILDINLGAVNGENVYRQIRGWCDAHEWEMPRIIFCTGYTPSPVLKRLVEPGVNRLMLKPAGTEVVVGTVQEVLTAVLGTPPECQISFATAAA